MTQSGQPQRYGLADKADLLSLSGLEFLQRILDGALPMPPICQTLGFRPVEVAPGRAVFEGKPDERHYNPIGSVHGGYPATLLDSCMACAVHSLLEPGVGYTTMEFKVTLTRSLTDRTGLIRAIGTVLSRGRRAAYAEGRLVDSADRLIAHGTTTCMVFPLSDRPS